MECDNCQLKRDLLLRVLVFFYIAGDQREGIVAWTENIIYNLDSTPK